MSTTRMIAGLALALTLATPAARADDDGAAAGIPGELKGFKGMVTGELVEKREAGLVFKVTSIKKVWKGNGAEHPEKAVGKNVTANLSHIGDHHRARIMENFRGLEAGDAIEVELFDLGEKTLCVKEWLRKAED